MPTLHILNSIKIDVYSREHLPPHFHALYAEHEILMVIKTLKNLCGIIANPATQHVLNWANSEELRHFC